MRDRWHLLAGRRPRPSTASSGYAGRSGPPQAKHLLKALAARLVLPSVVYRRKLRICHPAGGVAEGSSPKTARGASRSPAICGARHLRSPGGAPPRRAPHERGGPLVEVVRASLSRSQVPDVRGRRDRPPRFPARFQIDLPGAAGEGLRPAAIRSRTMAISASLVSSV